MPYPTRSSVVIEPTDPFMGLLVQLEPFDYSIVNDDQQRRVYKLIFQESSYIGKPAASINHNCTIKINDVVKISANKVNDISNNEGKEIFSIKM